MSWVNVSAAPYLWKYSSKFWFNNYLKSRSVCVFTLYLCVPESITGFCRYIQAQRDLTSYPDWSGGAFELSAWLMAPAREIKLSLYIWITIQACSSFMTSNDHVVLYEITLYKVEGGWCNILLLRKTVKIYSWISLPIIRRRWADGRTASREIFCTFRYEWKTCCLESEDMQAIVLFSFSIAGGIFRLSETSRPALLPTVCTGASFPRG